MSTLPNVVYIWSKQEDRMHLLLRHVQAEKMVVLLRREKSANVCYTPSAPVNGHEDPGPLEIELYLDSPTRAHRQRLTRN
jgi:hypothetical protein